jgi:hypothetical protein
VNRRTACAVALATLGAACSGPEDTAGWFATRLQKAIEARDVETVRSEIAAGAPLGRSVAVKQAAWYLSLLRIRDDDPRTTEIAALVLDGLARHGKTSAAAVVNQDVLVNHGRRSGPAEFRSPAWILAHESRASGLRLLVAKGLAVREAGAVTAFTHAVASDCVPCVAILLDAGTPIDSRDEQGRTPLGVARSAVFPAMAALLSSRGAAGRVGPSATAEQATLRVSADATQYRPETWMEGAAIAEHPAGRAVLQLAEQGDAKFPGVAAVRAGFAAGSVLLTHPTETEIRLVRFPQDDPQPGARTTVMELRVRPRPDGGFTVAFEQ